MIFAMSTRVGRLVKSPWFLVSRLSMPASRDKLLCELCERRAAQTRQKSR
jgi:hypothetical protein